jgi:hypothetical protein
LRPAHRDGRITLTVDIVSPLLLGVQIVIAAGCTLIVNDLTFSRSLPSTS